MKITLIDKNPEIFITLEALNKMNHYVRLSNSEIGWLGLVDREGDVFTIRDVFLVKQSVNGATCELDETSILDLYEDRLLKGLSIDNIALWGHSHVNMNASPSGQDEKQFIDFYKNNDYFIRIIMNKRGESNIALFDSSKGIMYEEMDWSILVEDISDEIQAEIDKNVKKIEYAFGKVKKGSKSSKPFDYSYSTKSLYDNWENDL